MAPTRFLPGDLVLVDFPDDGYWPAEITEVLKNSKREVKCFGEGERGYASPRDMVHFNDATMKTHLSDSSWKSDPARKKALNEIIRKSKEQNNSANNNPKNDGGARAMGKEDDNDLARKKIPKKITGKSRKQNINDKSIQKNEGGAKAMGNAGKKLKKAYSDPAQKKAPKQITGKYKKQNINDKSIQKNGRGAKAMGNDPARKKALKQITNKSKKKVILNNSYDNQKNKGGAKASNIMVGAHQATNVKLRNLQSEHEQLLKNFEETKRSLDMETQKRIELDNELEKINCQSDEEIKEIRVKVEAEYEEKRQKFSAVYEKKIEDLEAKLGEELVAVAGANQEIEDYRMKVENMTNDLKDYTIKHKDEISKKDDEIKLLNDQITQLEKEKGELEEKLALQKESVTHGTSVEELSPGLVPSPDSSMQGPRGVKRKRSIEVNASFTGEAMCKRKRLDTLDENSERQEVDKSYSEGDKNKRQNLEKDDSSMAPETDQSYSKEEKRLEEHESSMEVEESNVEQDMEVKDSHGNTNCHIM